MPPSAPLPVLGAIGSSAVPELRALLDDALPVKYPDAFYRSVPNMPRSLARGAYVERRLIGAVVCFVRAAESTAGWIRADADERLVVSMLAVRPDHRGRGVASASEARRAARGAAAEAAGPTRCAAASGMTRSFETGPDAGAGDSSGRSSSSMTAERTCERERAGGGI